MSSKTVFLFCILIPFLAIGCQTTELSIDEGCNQPACSDERLTISNLNQEVGEIGYSDEWNSYFINLKSSNQNFDNTKIAIPCDLDDEFKHVGKIVNVSGELKSSCNNPRPVIGGQQIYYLKIREIEGGSL